MRCVIPSYVLCSVQTRWTTLRMLIFFAKYCNILEISLLLEKLPKVKESGGSSSSLSALLWYQKESIMWGKLWNEKNGHLISCLAYLGIVLSAEGIYSCSYNIIHPAEYILLTVTKEQRTPAWISSPKSPLLNFPLNNIGLVQCSRCSNSIFMVS